MNKVLVINLFLFYILILVIVLFLTREIRNEGFDNTGALVQLASTEAFDNTGALTQLNSTRVVSEREQDINQHLYDNLTRQGIMNMTESGYKNYDSASSIY